MKSLHGRTALLVGAVALVIGLIGGNAFAVGQFVDVDPLGVHANNIDAIVDAGITLGCTDSAHFCPNNTVRRDQMASFLARLGGLSSGSTKNFPRVNGRSELQSYCAVATRSPASFDASPCRDQFFPMGQGFPFPKHQLFIDNFGLASDVAITQDGRMFRFTCRSADCHDGTNADHLGNFPSSLQITSFSARPLLNGPEIRVSYYDAATKTLGVANCVCPNADYWPLNAPAAPEDPDIGRYNALAVLPDTSVFVAAIDESNKALVGYKCGLSGIFSQCFDGVQTVTLDPGTSVKGPIALAIGADGFPVITYETSFPPGSGDDEVRVLHCQDAACSVGHEETIAPATGREHALAIGTDGFPVVATTTGDHFQLIHCENVACSAHTTALLSSGFADPDSASVTIGLSGFPIVAVGGTDTGGLPRVMLHSCRSLTCSSFSTQTMTQGSAQFGTPSVAVDRHNGVPILAARVLNNVIITFWRPAIT